MQLQLFGKQILLYQAPIDFRCSIDGLCALITQGIQQSPQDGIYLFYNKSKDKIKCLSWHKNGFVLLYKRLEQGRFQFVFHKASGVADMSTQEVGWMLAGLEWQQMRNWAELDYGKFS